MITRAMRNSAGSICYGLTRDPPGTLQTSIIRCDKDLICTQGLPQHNWWGHLEPVSFCVNPRSLSKIIVYKYAQFKEYCTDRMSIKTAVGKAGPQKIGKMVKFHAWLYDVASGFRQSAKWLYLKVNGSYIASANNTNEMFANWDVSKYDQIEMCFYPTNVIFDQQFDWQASLVKVHAHK
ncbi:hypothetical protein ACJQWK_10010 [Exserohilum turcicum]